MSLGPVQRAGADGGRNLRHRGRHGRVRDLAGTPRRLREGGQLPVLSPSDGLCERGSRPGSRLRLSGVRLVGVAPRSETSPHPRPRGRRRWREAGRTCPIRGSSQNDSARAMASAVGKVFSAASHTTYRGSHSGPNLALKRQRDSICIESDIRLSSQRWMPPPSSPASTARMAAKLSPRCSSPAWRMRSIVRTRMKSSRPLGCSPSSRRIRSSE